MKKRTILIFGTCALAGLVLLAILLSSGNEISEPAETAAPAKDGPAMRATATDPELPGSDVASSHEELEEPEPIHYSESGFDPNDQPRTHWVRNYRPGEIDEGYTMHNVELTGRGFELADAPPGHEGPRIGYVESPPLEADFPFNAIAPQWQEELPEGTSMLVELRFSPDGENWTAWYQTEVDHTSFGAVNEFMPDGTPNEGYHYTPGGLLAWGNVMWAYLQYNIAFYSETGANPFLSAQRLYFNDSTLGEGKLAVPAGTGFEGEFGSVDQGQP